MVQVGEEIGLSGKDLTSFDMFENISSSDGSYGVHIILCTSMPSVVLVFQRLV